MGAAVSAFHLMAGAELLGEGFDQPAAQTGAAGSGATVHTDAIVGDLKQQFLARPAQRNADLALEVVGEGMLQRVGDQLVDQDRDGDGLLGAKPDSHSTLMPGRDRPCLI